MPDKMPFDIYMCDVYQLVLSLPFHCACLNMYISAGVAQALSYELDPQSRMQGLS